MLKRNTSIIEGLVARLSAVGEKFFQLIGSPYEITGANAPAEELRTDGTALIRFAQERDFLPFASLPLTRSLIDRENFNV